MPTGRFGYACIGEGGNSVGTLPSLPEVAIIMGRLLSNTLVPTDVGDGGS